MKSGILRSNRPFIFLVGTITLFQTIGIPYLLQMSKQDVIQSRQSKNGQMIPTRTVTGWHMCTRIFDCQT
jgi:hypothetical protein